MAYAATTKVKCLAREFDVTPPTVRRNTNFIAATYLHSQLEWLHHVRDRCRQRRPWSVTVSRRWDETKEVVTLPVGDSFEKDSVEAMVNACRLVVSWGPGAPVLCMDLVMPPVPLVGTSSSDICAAICRHPLLQPINDAVIDIVTTADLRCWSHECDGASGNDRYHFGTAPRKQVREGCACELHLCSNHSHHLVSVSQVEQPGLAIAENLYTSGMFFCYNGHYRRLQLSIGLCVDGCLQVKYTRPPPAAAEYAEQIASFILRNESACAPTCGEGQRRRRQQRKRPLLEARSKEFASLFNGQWSEQ
ncbi:unnamed protein product, partial [Prorocentrum cordatum]